MSEYPIITRPPSHAHRFSSILGEMCKGEGETVSIIRNPSELEIQEALNGNQSLRILLVRATVEPGMQFLAGDG